MLLLPEGQTGETWQPSPVAELCIRKNFHVAFKGPSMASAISRLAFTTEARVRCMWNVERLLRERLLPAVTIMPLLRLLFIRASPTLYRRGG
jgi:hypothetical protein